MMKAPFSLLLCLLALALIPGNGSANKHSFDPVSIILYGTDHLKETFTYTFENFHRVESKLEDTIKEFEELQEKLPADVSKLRKAVLKGLYRTEDEVHRIRDQLELFAYDIKSDSVGLLKLFKKNNYYGIPVKKFINLAMKTEKTFKESEDILGEVQERLRDTRAELVDYGIDVEDGTSRVTGSMWKWTIGRNVLLNTGMYLMTSWNPVVAGFVFGFDVVRSTIYTTDIWKLVTQIKDTLKYLRNHTEEFIKYVRREIKYIGAWKKRLQDSVQEVEAGPSDIEAIIRHLNELVVACDNYLNNELPKDM